MAMVLNAEKPLKYRLTSVEPEPVEPLAQWLNTPGMMAEDNPFWRNSMTTRHLNAKSKMATSVGDKKTPITNLSMFDSVQENNWYITRKVQNLRKMDQYFFEKWR